MKQQKLAVALAAALSFGASVSAVAADQPDPNRVYVVFKQSAQPIAYSDVEATVVRAGGTVHRQFKNLRATVMSVPPMALQGLKNHPAVERVEPDVVRYPMAQTVPYGIPHVQAPEAVSVGADGDGIKVCIIDSGIKADHEDFAGITITGQSGQDWNIDGCGHGTHVAGTIAAADNDVGVIGVSPGKVALHIVKVFGNSVDTSCAWSYSSSLVAAAQECESAGAKIISMSLGGGSSNTTESNAFQTLLDNGILSIAAAGNAGNTTKSYPASYDSVMSVAAIDSNNALASFSQRNDQVEIAAPGVSVLSTYSNVEGYAYLNGTSMATPHVSGVAALVWSADPSATAEEIRTALTSSTIDLGNAGRDNSFGCGLVQAFDAIDVLLNGGGTACGDPPPPTINVLQNGVTVANLGANTGSQLYYSLEVPAGASDLSFATTGGSGDNDLYVRFGSLPSSSTYDCRPYLDGNEETCSIATPQAGTYYVMLDAYSTFAGVSLTGSFTAPNSPPTASFTYTCDGLTCDFDGTGSSDSDGSIASYAWSFGGSTATAEHTFAEAGTYPVTLTVTDDDGATHESSQDVTVTVPVTIPSLTISDISVVEGNSGSRVAYLTVELSQPASQTVTFKFATADGTATAGEDYLAIASTPTGIVAGQTSKQLAVRIYGDTNSEADETLSLALTNVVGATVAQGTAQVTIQNDDAPSLSISDVSIVEGNSGSRVAYLTVELSQPASQTVTFKFATADGTATAGEDYLAIASTPTGIVAGQTSKQLAVRIYGDTSSEVDEAFSVALTNVVGANTAQDTATVTIQNDD